MCKKDRTLEENVDGAETLFCLIEEDPVLQEVASICDHSLRSLAEYLSYADIQQIDSRQAQKNVWLMLLLSVVAAAHTYWSHSAVNIAMCVCLFTFMIGNKWMICAFVKKAVQMADL